MKKTAANKAFTLIEASVSVLVISLIMTALIALFRHNLNAFRHGESSMDFMQKNQLVIKQIFTDLKNVNPLLTGDNPITFKGERSGDLTPNSVFISDIDKNLNNGFEYLTYSLLDLNDTGKRTRLEYYIKDGCLYRTVKPDGGGLNKEILARHISELHFLHDPQDVSQLRVVFSAKDPKSNRVEKIDFAVRLESGLVCIKPSYAGGTPYGQ